MRDWLTHALSSHTIGARPLVSSKERPHATSAAYLGGAGSLHVTHEGVELAEGGVCALLEEARVDGAQVVFTGSASGSPRKLAFARLSARVTPRSLMSAATEAACNSSPRPYMWNARCARPRSDVVSVSCICAASGGGEADSAR